tara:strand:+ start:192 stop:332 length:141 start_codon:yes stop_codon:yes gene_type:complete
MSSFTQKNIVSYNLGVKLTHDKIQDIGSKLNPSYDKKKRRVKNKNY